MLSRNLSTNCLSRTRAPALNAIWGTWCDDFACADIADYAKGGSIANWPDFLATAAVVRPMLGISPSAWEDAQSTMGEIPAAIVLAAILQRGSAISSAGGYSRGLARKAQAGEFSLGPMLMAPIGARCREALL
jgi:replication initiation protein RepC